MAGVQNCPDITILINLFGQDQSQGALGGHGGQGGQSGHGQDRQRTDRGQTGQTGDRQRTDRVQIEDRQGRQGTDGGQTEDLQRTDRADLRHTKLTFKLDSPGNLYLAAFAILAMFLLLAST